MYRIYYRSDRAVLYATRSTFLGNKLNACSIHSHFQALYLPFIEREILKTWEKLNISHNPTHHYFKHNRYIKT